MSNITAVPFNQLTRSAHNADLRRVSYWTVPGRIVLCNSCIPGLITQERRHTPSLSDAPNSWIA